MREKLKNIRTAELLILIASENKDAFGEFFKRYHSKMVEFASLFVHSPNDAEEVVSQVVEKLLKQRKKIAQIENFENYLFTSIKNTSINLNKNFSKKSFVPLTESNNNHQTSYLQPYESLLESELRVRVTQCIEQLPNQRKLVYKLIKDEDQTIDEVAELLNLSVKTVKNHLALAIKDLRFNIELYLNDSNQIPILKVAKIVGLLLLFFP